MKIVAKLGAIALVSASILATGASAQEGAYLRKGKEIVILTLQGGKLFCTRQSDGFEMCNGMSLYSDGTYRGKNMRHPAMPKFMKFNGTVSFTDSGLNIRGCALGVCKAEDWVKQ